LPANVSLAAVTTTPAAVMGLDHRIGYIRQGDVFFRNVPMDSSSGLIKATAGYDAGLHYFVFSPESYLIELQCCWCVSDVVVWDSHPLSLGATPIQVFVDGISQLSSPFRIPLKSQPFQSPPRTPDFDAEAQAAVKWEGLPPLVPSSVSTRAAFVNVSSFWQRDDTGSWVEKNLVSAGSDLSGKQNLGIVIVEEGSVVCAGTYASCSFINLVGYDVISLDGGSIAPGLVAFGPALGLHDIWLEPVTNDGLLFDPLRGKVPSITGGDELLVRAVDGLQFGTRNTL
jgi:hypothetical protein